MMALAPASGGVEVIICKHAFMIVSVFLMRKQARFTAQREKVGV